MTVKVSSIMLTGAVLFLFSCAQSGEESTHSDSTTYESQQVGANALSVAYIMEDSILSGYDYVKEEGKRLEERVSQKQFQIQQEMSAYQAEATRWEELLSKSQDQATYDMAMQDMQKRERDLQVMQSGVEQMQIEFSESLTKRVQDYLKVYAEEHGIDIIFNDAQVGSSLLYSSDRLDITDEILKNLNEEYALETEEEGEE